MRTLSNYLTVFSIAALATIVIASNTAHTQQTENEILLDAISVLVGSRASKESDATPLLLSDVEFEATLILVGRFGPGGLHKRMTKTLWLEGRRRVTLIRLLANQARQLHEVATIVEKKYLLQEIVEQMGGKKPMDNFLIQLGVGRDTLNVWIENAALALTQIGYVEEQVELPSNKDIEARIARDSKSDNSASKDIREKYREMIMEEKTDEQIRRWLIDLSLEGSIRVIR